MTLSKRLAYVSLSAAVFAIAMSLVVIVGWHFDLPTLRSSVPGLVAMNPMTAVAFFLSGVCLWWKATHTRDSWARALGAIVLGIGVLKLIDYATGVVGIDRLFYNSKLGIGTGFPNRMAPNTTVNFILLGAAVLSLDVKSERQRVLSHWGLLIILTTSAFAILGYSYDVLALYQIPSFIPMSLPTALTFCAIATGTLASRETGFMRLFSSKELAGYTLRHVLPPILFVPPILGALLTYGRNAGYLTPAQGMAILVLASMLVASVVVLHTCASLDHAERSRRLAERQVEEQRARSVHATKMASLGEMAGGVAHEINNPLAIIQGKASNLRRRLTHGEIQPAEVVGELEKIEATVGRISRITTSLLTFSHASKEMPLNRHTIRDVVDETLALCGERFLRAGIQIRREIPPGIEVRCRRPYLGQVFLSLLTNAQQAVEGRPEKWIEIQATEEPDAVVVAITDSGAGIAPEIREKIFQPFFTTRSIGQGTGLGLSVSKSLLEDDGGTLTLDTTSPRTRFLIRLPRAKSAFPVGKAA